MTDKFLATAIKKFYSRFSPLLKLKEGGMETGKNAFYEISDNLKFAYGQDYNPYECDVAWRTVDLPEDQVFSKEGETLKGTILCDSRYNGIWMSKRSKLLIYFHPPKTLFRYFTPNIVSARGLLNMSIRGYKNKPILCDFMDRLAEFQVKDRKKIEQRILKYLGDRNFRIGKHKRWDTPHPNFFRRYAMQPLPDYIASNYTNIDYNEVKVMDLLDILKAVGDETLLYSPYMSPEDEYNHCHKIYTEIGRAKVEFSEHSTKLKELKEFVKSVILQLQTYKSSYSVLDHISVKALELGFNLSKLIYNYTPLATLDENVKTGIYPFFKANKCMGITTTLLYKNPIRLKEGDTISLKGIDHHNNLYALYGKDRKEFKRIEAFSEELKVDDEMKKGKYIDIIQLQKYEYDIIRTNSKHFSTVTGSVRINPLATYLFQEK